MCEKIEHECKRGIGLPLWKQSNILLQKWVIPGLFIIGLFKQTLHFLQKKLMWKDAHPVSGGRIQTHDLLNHP